MKRCKDCQQLKLPTEFYANRTMADGLLNRCKTCHCATVRAINARKPKGLRPVGRPKSAKLAAKRIAVERYKR